MPRMKVALRPESEAPRRPCQVERGTTNFVIHDNDANSTAALRLQRLRLLGIIGQRAGLLADLAWEVAA